MAPRQAIAIREIVYQLSPYQQDIIGQAFKNAPRTLMHFIQEKGPGLVILGVSYFSAKQWLLNEMHKERMNERF